MKFAKRTELRIRRHGEQNVEKCGNQRDEAGKPSTDVARLGLQLDGFTVKDFPVASYRSRSRSVFDCGAGVQWGGGF